MTNPTDAYRDREIIQKSPQKETVGHALGTVTECSLREALHAWDAYEPNCSTERMVEQANAMAKAIRAALANGEASDNPPHVLVIGTATLRRLANGESVWIDAAQAGAVAADDFPREAILALIASGECP